ncbi:translocation/assembly module TamB domain-containing protein [Selenomonas sp. F0473]|uniref:translocation/assembly module TamB domain-containing protein n=1 Tax=Selenomonas sp. F0473 TaxID=999423 RepID=UPI0025D6787B|nr:translocation/assembly module TamB domain-containing protein [Selenomonas sp. F0473]
MRRKAYVGIAVLTAMLVCAAAILHIVRAQAFMTQVGAMAESLAAQTLGTDVHIGAVEIRSLHEFTIDDIVVYDKQAEPVLRADEARVTLRLLSLLSSPAASVDEIQLVGAHAHIVRRADGTWNYGDLVSAEEEPSAFAGRIRLTDATADIAAEERSASLKGITGTADIDRGDISCDLVADLAGVPLRVRGESVGGTQKFRLATDDAALLPLLDFLPAGAVPADVDIHSLHAGHIDATWTRVDGVSTLDGRADGVEAAAQVYGTETAVRSAALTFNDRALFIAATAEAEGETARIDGTIRLDTDAPYLDLTVRAKDFAVDKILKSSPYQGPVTADVRLTGTLADFSAAGTLTAAAGTAYGVSFTDASAEVSYESGVLGFRDLKASVFGGTVAGEGLFDTGDLSYTAHLMTKGAALARLRTDAGLSIPDGTEGAVDADLGISGRGTAREALTVYGSAAVMNGIYRNIPVERASTSFMLRGNDLTIDFLSLNLPNDSDLGVEGHIIAGSALDLHFYGGHADLSLLNRLDDRLSFAGFADFSGTVRGDINDPQVEMKFSATRGQLMHQPFDSLLFRAEGSLSGVGIHDFSMERGGREVWLVHGTVGFTGERRIDVQIDTMGARMEDVAALVAPDQPITGNIDNIIKFTGTLDNPRAVGYVHFYRGSYGGVLLSGMDGDYFLEDGIIRLQVFHIYSPMVDMVLNGTITAQGVLDLDAEVRDLDMKRFQHKLPYAVEGHGTFNGKVVGTISHPIFRGSLKADRIVMNGAELTDIRSFIHYENGIVEMDDTGFRQGAEGTVSARLHYDTESQALRGTMEMEKFDVGALLALANQKEDRITGQITSRATFGGTRDNPSAALTGTISSGTVAGYPVTDVAVDIALADHVLTLKTVEGRQGAGTFSAHGTVSEYGTSNVDITASDIALGMFTGLAGIPEEVTGTATATAHIGGSMYSPEIDMNLTALNGGIHGSSFDELTGTARLRGSVIQIDSLTVKKSIDGMTYTASARGKLPLRALTARRDEALAAYDQIDLTLSLDNADLSLLPVFSDRVEWAVGHTEGGLKIGGTLAAPRIEGSLRVTSGAVKFKGVEYPLTDMQVRIDALGDSVVVRECTGRMGTGSYMLTGQTKLRGVRPTDYDFSLVMSALDLKTSFYDGPLTGMLRLTEDTYWGETLPKISGTIDIDHALISIPTIPDTEDELPHIILDVGLTVGRRVHFFSANLYDMHPSGSVHFGGTTRHPRTTGQISVRRGDTVSYLRTVFKIREGTATFNQMESFLPEIDFYAETRIARTRIYLSAHGPLDHMDFKLGSSPEMSEEEIIRMLTLRSAYGSDGKLTAAEILSIGLQMSVLSEVEDSVKNLLHLDVLRLSSGSGALFETRDDEAVKRNENEYNVEIGKYLSDRVLVRYVQGIGSAADKHRYGVQYDFNDKFSVSYDREGSDQLVGFEARIRF